MISSLPSYEHSEVDKAQGIISTVCVASLASSVSCGVSSNTGKESYEDNGYGREEIISVSLGQPRSTQLQTSCHLASYTFQGSFEDSKYQNTERERIKSPSLRVSRNLLAKSQNYIPAFYEAHDLNRHKYKTSLHKYEDNLLVNKSEVSTFMEINDYWPVFIKNFEPNLDKQLFLASNTTQVHETDCLPNGTSALGKPRSLNDSPRGSLKKGAII